MDIENIIPVLEATAMVPSFPRRHKHLKGQELAY